MTAAVRANATGLLGPVGFYAGATLLALAPLMRGGNRFVALVPLELIALVVLVSLAVVASRSTDDAASTGLNLRGVLLLAAAPLLVAAVQLVPLLPGTLWLKLPGHGAFASAAEMAGAVDRWRPLSVAPDATAASLLAGLPLAAALLLGFFSTVEELRTLLRVVVAVALLEIFVSVLQLGGDDHFLMLGALSTAPVGTFGNRNHLGDYLAMALVCWIWLAWGRRQNDTAGPTLLGAGNADKTAVRVAIASVLLIGLLLTRSRAAVMFGLPAAIFALALTRLVRRETAWYWRWMPVLALLLLVAAVWLLGADVLTARFTDESLGDAADFRATLARTSFDAAMAFFPFGSGWGTYDLVYPAFQPAFIAKFANHAHMDYVELFVEGGVLFLAFAGVFAWLAARRARVLWRIISQGHRASREAIAASFCGLALAVVLMHSLVDFNLRIPANAILACLLAGAFLRPLPARKPTPTSRFPA